MALPPRGDPRRPLHLAIRSTRNFGIFFVLVGSFAATRLVTTRGGQTGALFVPSPAVLFAWLLYLVPGTLFLVFSVFMRRRRLWAVVGALVLTSLSALFVTLAAVAIVVAMNAEGEARPARVVVVLAAWTATEFTIAQLIYRLARSLKAIKHVPFGAADDPRGFEPLPAARVRRPIIGPKAFPPQPVTDPADGKDTTYDPAAPR
jgi:hypothetical protein